jgi:hypothetical protein
MHNVTIIIIVIIINIINIDIKNLDITTESSTCLEKSIQFVTLLLFVRSTITTYCIRHLFHVLTLCEDSSDNVALSMTERPARGGLRSNALNRGDN